jgi:hypothetical protein
LDGEDVPLLDLMATRQPSWSACAIGSPAHNLFTPSSFIIHHSSFMAFIIHHSAFIIQELP